jgi:hypothetical protein
MRLQFFVPILNADRVRARLLSGGGRFLPVENAAVVDDFYGNAGINIQWLIGIKGQPISGYLGFDYQIARDNLSTRSFSIGIKIPLYAEIYQKSPWNPRAFSQTIIALRAR